MGLADDWLDIKQVISLFHVQPNGSYNARYGHWTGGRLMWGNRRRTDENGRAPNVIGFENAYVLRIFYSLLSLTGTFCARVSRYVSECRKQCVYYDDWS